jgi:hypothetical protein
MSSRGDQLQRLRYIEELPRPDLAFLRAEPASQPLGDPGDDIAPTPIGRPHGKRV